MSESYMLPQFSLLSFLPRLLALLAVLLVACTPQAPMVRQEGSIEPERLAALGRHVEAAEAWLERAEQFPERADLVSRARLEAAAQWLAAGRGDAARRQLALLSSLTLDSAEAIELELLHAELALLEGDTRAAARLAAGLPDQLPAALEIRYAALRQRLAETGMDGSTQLLQQLRLALAETDFRPVAALPGMIELPLAELRRLRREHDTDPVLVPWLDLALTTRQALLDPAALDDALLEWTQRWDLPSSEATELALWVESWRAEQSWPDSIAVLLPGDGPLLRAGEVLRDGLLAAWLEQPVQRRPALEFIHLDARADAAVGARFDAAERGHSLVIGPLPREQVEAVLALPDSAVPQILLNRPRDMPTGSWWARSMALLALPPEEEAELIAVHALVEMHQRAVVVAQSSDFGRRMAARFSETFELGGGRVVGRADYVSDEFDHTERLSVLLEVDRSEQRIEALTRLLGERVEAIAQRRSDIDVVFLAARGGDARQLMPQLRFLDLDELPVYATSGILTGDDPGRDLDGIRLPVAPWLLTEGAAAQRRHAAERFYPDLSGSPSLSLLHALGRDALALARWLGRMKQDPELYLAGDVGRLRLADGLGFERDLPWAIIRGGQPQPLTGN